jgi:hypothetical protein
MLIKGDFVGVILFSTYFYTSKELSTRLAVFWSTLNVARVISALLAAGILKMRGIGGHTGWFWLFLLEGLLTCVIALVVSLVLPVALCQGYMSLKKCTVGLSMASCQPNGDQECYLA